MDILKVPLRYTETGHIRSELTLVILPPLFPNGMKIAAISGACLWYFKSQLLTSKNNVNSYSTDNQKVLRWKRHVRKSNANEVNNLIDHAENQFRSCLVILLQGNSKLCSTFFGQPWFLRKITTSPASLISLLLLL